MKGALLLETKKTNVQKTLSNVINRQMESENCKAISEYGINIKLQQKIKGKNTKNNYSYFNSVMTSQYTKEQFVKTKTCKGRRKGQNLYRQMKI